MGLKTRSASVPFGFVAIAAAVTLGGCATSPEASLLPTEPAVTASPTAPAVAVPDDVEGSFRRIADASCEKANAEGVTESAVDGSGRLILVPKGQGYEDFSAASISDSGVGELIWSTEVFYACNASIGFSFSDESGSDYGTIEFNETDGSYTVTVGEAGSEFVATYTVQDGLIRTGSSTRDGEALVLDVEYGMPSETDIQILRDTVDAFLAEDG
jgi:hypothetical protein